MTVIVHTRLKITIEQAAKYRTPEKLIALRNGIAHVFDGMDFSHIGGETHCVVTIEDTETGETY